MAKPMATDTIGDIRSFINRNTSRIDEEQRVSHARVALNSGSVTAQLLRQHCVDAIGLSRNAKTSMSALLHDGHQRDDPQSESVTLSGQRGHLAGLRAIQRLARGIP
jgi:hypothetical protein